MRVLLLSIITRWAEHQTTANLVIDRTRIRLLRRRWPPPITTSMKAKSLKELIGGALVMTPFSIT